MKKVFIIANPAARRFSKRKIGEALSFIRRRGFNEELIYTEAPGDGIRLVREILKKERDIHAIVAAGGDGTFNEVANGLIGSNIPMAILPLGTTNVLAKELNIPEDVTGALGLLDSGPVTVRPARIINKDISRYFLLMAGIGFDAEAVHGVNKGLKRVSGKLAYIISGLRSFITYKPSLLRIIIDNQEVKGYNAVICKASCYGGSFKMAPDASLKDPYLYAVIFAEGSRRSLIRYITGVIAKRHVKFNDVIYKKASRVFIDGDGEIQIDGDYFGKGPVEISSGSRELMIFIPNNSS